MATSQKLKDDFLTCQICFEVYQNPRTLPCEHTYCTGCLTKYIKTQTEAVKTKSIPCSSCRRQIPVPNPARPVEEWVTQFKTGLVIRGLMDSFGHDSKDTDNCSVCKEDGQTTPATHWCSECEASLCDGCLKLHRKMPVLRHHAVSYLTGETPCQQVKKKTFVCKKHNKKIKLFCRDCKKTLCTVCCSVGHRACKDVVEIQEMLPEVKEELSVRQTTIDEQIDAASNHIRKIKTTNDEFAAKTEKVKSEINQTFNTIVDLLQRKKKQLLNKVDNIKDKQTEELKAKIKCEEISRHTYQQQSQFIQQALKFEDEAQLYEMYLSSGSGAVAGNTDTYSEDRTDVVDISFTYNIENLRENIDMMDVTTVCEDVIDLTAPPVLQEVVDMKLDGRCDLRDVVVLNNNGIKSVIASVSPTKCIKSVYIQNGRKCSSQLKVKTSPWSLAVLHHSKVAVSIPSSKQILTVGVNPDLVLLSTITTSKAYYGLAVLDQSTLRIYDCLAFQYQVTSLIKQYITTLEDAQILLKTYNGLFLIHVNMLASFLIKRK